MPGQREAVKCRLFPALKPFSEGLSRQAGGEGTIRFGGRPSWLACVCLSVAALRVNIAFRIAVCLRFTDRLRNGLDCLIECGDGDV
jgi:hypothetical protein